MKRLRLISLLIALLILPVATVLGQDLAAQERAASMIEEERFSEAIVILNELISENSRDSRALLLRARAHEGRGDSMGAARDYERVLQLDPGNTDALDGLRRTTGGDRPGVDRNIESLKRLVALNPDNLSYRIRLADALFEARRFREAAVEYGTYLDRIQGTPDVVQSYLISIAGYEGDNALGERVAERYTRIYSTNDDLYMRLGYFRIWQGKYRLAEQACEQALRLNPSNAEARNCVGIARDPDLASAQSEYPIDVLVRELGATPDDDTKRFQLVDLLIDAGRYFEANQQLDRLAPEYRGSNEWETRRRLVQNRIQTDPGPQRQQQTLFIVDRLYNELEANPDNDEKRFRLVEELVRYDRFQEAFNELLKLEPEHGTTDRWLTNFLAVDKGIMQPDGTSTIYPIDRFTYLLRATPNDQMLRFRLVDQLIEANRFAEAFDVLTDTRYSDPTVPGYRARLQRINEVREQRARERITELSAVLAEQPDNEGALEEIIDNYLLLEQTDEALRAYARLIELRPDNLDIRAEYVDVLRLSGYEEEAVKQASWLLDRRPDDVRFMRLFAMSQLTAGEVTERGESVIASLLSGPAAMDTELLVMTASYRLSNGQLEATEFLLDRAEATEDPRFASQIDTLRQLLARERIRAEQQRYAGMLNEARRLVAAERYDSGIAAYERYFEARGKRTRVELKELAQVHVAAENYDEALSILFALQQEVYEYSVAKQIARTQNLREDYSGALATLERLQSENPRDYEVRFMQAEALRQLGLFEQAKAVYNEALLIADDSENLEERTVAIDADIRASLAQSGEFVGNNFAGIIVPTIEATRSRGGGTQYDRWAQGMQTQVTTPLPLVVMAGVNSHFISGSRRLVPGAEIVRGRVNQVWTGGYFDFTPPIRSDRASYTNRLSFDFGLYDYEGSRTVTYGQIRYWRQQEGVYNGSIGLKTGEGSIDLWSPGGGQFNLRLTQLNLIGSSMALMPDSVLRVAGNMSLNVVRDNFGNTASETDTNFGTNIRLEAGYKIVDHTFLGLEYFATDYRSTVDIYFSPSNYESFDIFLEYENEAPQNWYLRVRGAMGIVARSAGFVSRRLEADYIKRMGNNFSLSVTTGMSASTRTLGSGATAFIDRYNTFTLGAALYWTL